MSQLVIEGVTVRVEPGMSYEMDPWGDFARAFSGRQRSDIDARHRRYQVTTPPLDKDDALGLRVTLQSPGPLLCSGPLVGEESRMFHARSVQVRTLQNTEQIVSFQLHESEDVTTSDLLYSIDGAAPGSTYTLTRSGAVGKYVDSEGLVQEAAANTLRITHVWDGTAYVPYILVEDARTNLVSTDDITAWTNTISAPTVSSGIEDPAGGTNAYRISDTGSGAQGKYTQPSFTGDGVKGLLFCIRPRSTSSYIRLRLFDNGAAAERLDMRLTAWTSETLTFTESTGTLLWYRKLANGYWLIYVKTSSVTAANAHLLEITPDGGASGTGAVDIFRVNAFNDEVPSCSILDAGETRNADTLYDTYSVDSEIPITIYFRGIEHGMSDENLSTIVHVGDGTDTAAQAYLYNNGGTLKGYVEAGTAEVEEGDATAPSYGDDVQLRFSVPWDSTISFGQAENGGAEDDDTGSGPDFAPSSWAGTQIHLGSRGSGRRCPALLARQVRVFRGDKSLAKCTAMAGARLHRRA